MYKQKPLILVVEDDEDDWILLRDAFKEAEQICRSKPGLCRLKDGVELLDYLRCIEQGAGDLPWPDLILLDLNMPRMSGREVLLTIKSNPVYQAIPTVIYTTSDETTIIIESYEHGANSVLVKPDTFDNIIKAMLAICRYWFRTASLPATPHAS